MVRATPLRDATLILHSARWATHQRTPGGDVLPIRDVEAKAAQCPVDLKLVSPAQARAAAETMIRQSD